MTSKMSIAKALLLIGSVGALMGPVGAQDASKPYPKAVHTYEELAREDGLTDPTAVAFGHMAIDVGGKDWGETISFRCNATGGHIVSGLTAPKATKVFDNLYFVGAADVASWAVVTPQGIILIDSLTTSDEAQRYIVDGLKSVGLNPADVRYILVSHEHGDHYGGAPLIVSLSNAHVAMSETAWKGVDGVRSGSPLARSPRPKRDMVLTDGGTVTLGDTTITAVATPGHTPGTMSFIIPVKYQGQIHHAAFWGGNGLPWKPELQQQFLDSINKFATATIKAGVDIEISPHGDTDDTVQRVNAIGHSATRVRTR